MDINLTMKDSLVKRFKNFFNFDSALNISRLAFMVLGWVMGESEKGRDIYSCEKDGTDKKKLLLPLRNQEDKTNKYFKWVCRNCHSDIIKKTKPYICPECDSTTFTLDVGIPVTVVEES